jgi:MipA family protein
VNALGIVLAASSLTVLGAMHAAEADEQPLWEFGMGIGTLLFRDYRGADTTHAYPIPVPYFIYRGKFLKADRDGLRGKLFNQDRVELNISLSATTPVRNDSARQGMPDLRPTVELGPSLAVHLWRSRDQGIKFDLRLPARAAFTIESPPHSIGWVLAPNISLDIKDVAGRNGWNFGLLSGPLFAERRYDQYFYSVAPQFAAPGRPAYEPSGGYAGADVITSLSKRFSSFWIGAYVRYDNLSGASFEASPLVKSRAYWSGGFGIAWMIKQSARLVESED